ncbi:MAG TPA: hypothetical protein VFN07_08835 [Trueperaceae bacterium]|nr:hypothetical protein [Trueperaceae bacterium]HRP47915.1 hypothetical protein [Trueperaceae bacterium]
MAERDLAKELDELKKNLKDLQKDLHETAASSGSVAGDAVEALRGRLESEAERLMAKLRGAASGAAETGERTLHNVEGKIEERPFASVLTVFGVGLVVGWLLGRK